jgi:flagellar biogenesis protein FliO
MLFGLGFIVALIFVTLNYGLKRVFHVDPSMPVVVRVHERVPLEPKKAVYVVEVGDEYLLLGVGEKEISFLTRLDRDATQAALARKEGSDKAGKPFWARLASGGRPLAAVPSPPGAAHETSADTRDDAQEA